MATFVLVHGAWHGRWCWDRLVPELLDRGQVAVAVDLPVTDGTATFADYARVATDAVAGVEGPIVAVGHSLGAMVIPLVAAARPVDALVFLCPVVPNFDGSPWDGAPPMEEAGAFEPLVKHDDGATSWPSVEAASYAFYDDCAPADQAWAFARLRPQNSSSLWTDRYPLDAWPPTRRIAILGADDRTVRLEYGRFVSADRLGVEPFELPGGHSPFLARPGALADAMVGASMS